MAKGANYLNNNKGVYLQASKKKKEAMPMCNYGRGCTNRFCIYRHPTGHNSDASYEQSREPCMAFLAGICAFDSKGCRKRHPSKEEAARLRTKYMRIKCRFRDDCKTQGCLYQHPSDETVDTTPLEGTNLAWDNQCHFVPPTVHQFQQTHNFVGQQPANEAYHQDYFPPVEHQLNPQLLRHEQRPSLPNINAPEFVPGKMSFVHSSATGTNATTSGSDMPSGSDNFK